MKAEIFRSVAMQKFPSAIRSNAVQSDLTNISYKSTAFIFRVQDLAEGRYDRTVMGTLTEATKSRIIKGQFFARICRREQLNK
jgi:hypothetical protein